MAPNINGFCAVLTTGGVDCWGSGGSGRVWEWEVLSHRERGERHSGGGQRCWRKWRCSPESSAFPEGTTTLPAPFSAQAGWTVGAPAWGSTSPASTTPVIVKGVGAKGNLAAVASVVQDASEGYGLGGDCAVLTTGGVDCWGDGTVGEAETASHMPRTRTAARQPLSLRAVQRR